MIRDYFSNLKYTMIYNLLRFNNMGLSRQNISLIASDVFVQLNEDVDKRSFTLIKNYNNVIESVYENVKNKKQIDENLLNYIIQETLINIINYSLLTDIHQDFIVFFKSMKWKHISSYDFLKNLANLSVYISDKKIFNEYTFNIICVLCFCLPLMQKIYPITLKYSDKEKISKILETKNTEELFDFFENQQQKEEQSFKGTGK